jgi:nucleoside-diphosphate-sugar epimerase
MRALVTGATGFIGGNLANHLLSMGWEVNLLVRREQETLNERLPGSRQITGIFGQDQAEKLQAAVSGCDVVFHTAAIRNRWGTPPEAYRAVNVSGTEELLKASDGLARRFVYVSSVGVYGYPGVLNINETFPVVDFANVHDYHSSKAAAEHAVRTHTGQIETVIIRPTITYGPGDESGMITRLIAMVSAGRFFQVGNGENFLHLTHIDDLISCLVLAGVHPAASGQTFNAAGPEPVRFRDLVHIIAEQTRKKTSKLFLPGSIANLAGFCIEGLLRLLGNPNITPPISRQMVKTVCENRSFDAGKASRLLGYRPVIMMQEGIHRTIEWMNATSRLPDFS